jgi:hypothetical protein
MVEGGAVMSQEEYDRLKMNWAVQNGGMSPDPVHGTTTHLYNLFNLTIKKVLCYQSRSGNSINLGWCDAGQAFHVRFAKQDGSDGPIVYEEPIAIAVVRGKFVKYQSGRDGINLGWSDTPAFEWSFIGGTPGDAVLVGTVVALHNSVENADRGGDCLFYQERTNGINLKWVLDDGEWNRWGKVRDTFKKVASVYSETKSYF